MANNQKKTAALVALADSKTLSEAAGKAGISPRTLYTYIHDDLEFSKAYRDIQEQAKITVMESIAGSVESAIGVIKSPSWKMKRRPRRYVLGLQRLS